SEKDEDYFFSGPADLAALDHLDATEVLAERWQRRMPSDGEEDSDQLAAIRGPFSSEFPGLAPPEDAKLSMAQLYAALRSLPDAGPARGAGPRPRGRRRPARRRLVRQRPVPDPAPGRGGPALLGGKVWRQAPDRGPWSADTAAGRKTAADDRGRAGHRRRTLR